MNEHVKDSNLELISMASEIVASYLSNHSVPTEKINDLIGEVYGCLQNIHGHQTGQGTGGHLPAVPVEDSVHEDFIICLEDGKKLKMLKRHLRTNYKMTPADYRLKWGLPADYPMVAPSYTARRSAFAKTIGLGHTNHKGRGRKPLNPR